MVDPQLREVLGGAALYVLCFMAILFLRILPLNLGFMGWPGPDLALCLTFAWVLRRPDRLPALLIAVMFLVEDILLMRPIGLGAAIVLVATETARLREARWRDQPFMVEWLRVGLLLGAMMLGYRFVQILFLLPVPALGQVILQFIATLAAYPLVVVTAQWLFGLRRVSPAEADMNRYR
ncbi:rod shape-determining protein MreD [Paracoccus zhejiangensis]|uniref:Rod shape-determining protein MreD n=1 Tax=Paracoccus zhejiangensis TaxID=1077935 RepID=A0A2H5EXU9_9RHOB|nr:rod shape-determining protein MreD [Paracoccus zhejiangensis]AUH64125.1 rod shape-determining protein MreD [Paracoccus zhejiangensis]